MIDLNELLEQVWPLACQRSGEIETLPIKQALGRVLARDVLSTLNVPQHDNSGMDGYAVRCADLAKGVQFAVSQRVPAGTSPLPLQAGTVARIFTGAPIPSGADAVVMQEDASVLANGLVSFNAVPTPNQWIRRAGEDIACGQLVVPKGTVLDAVHVGLLASIGVDRVEVVKRLKVGVMVTGSELQNPGKALEPGQIYNSNEFVWCGFLQTMNIEVESVGIVPDNLEATCRALERLAQCRHRLGRESALQPRHPQFPDELPGIDDIGSITGQGDQHALFRRADSAQQHHQIKGVQRQHEHREHVFPEERRGEQPFAEHHLLPDRAGDHDGVKHQRLDHDREVSGPSAFTGGKRADHQAEAHKKHRELQRGQHALHQRPDRLVAPFPLFSSVKCVGLAPRLARPFHRGSRFDRGCVIRPCHLMR